MNQHGSDTTKYICAFAKTNDCGYIYISDWINFLFVILKRIHTPKRNNVYYFFNNENITYKRFET